jgi:hypothetical protein
MAYSLAAKIVGFLFLCNIYVHHTNTDKNNTYIYSVGKRMIVSEFFFSSSSSSVGPGG